MDINSPLKTCRSCLSERNAVIHLFSAVDEDFNLSISDKYQISTNLSIEEDDDLPQYICCECYDHLQITYKFRKMCQDSEILLRSKIYTTNSILCDIKIEPLTEMEKAEIEESEIFIKKEKTVSDNTILRNQHSDKNSVGDHKNDTKNVQTPTKVNEVTEKFYDCEICNKMFNSASSLQFHMTEHDDKVSFKCELCSRKFSRKQSLILHKRSHDHIKAYHDDHFKSQDTTDQNKKSAPQTKERKNVGKNGKISFECNYCGRKFAQKSSLNTHLTLHTGKPYQCTLCELRFSRPAHLKVHMRVHTRNYPYTCSVCSKCFKQSSHLAIHVKESHIGTKYPCTMCEKVFRHHKSWTTHVTQEHKLNLRRKYKCFKCDIHFDDINEFNTHTNQHVTEVEETNLNQTDE